MSFIIPFIGFVYFIYHLVLSFKLLKKYRKQVKENYSYSRGIDLKWLSIWIYGLISFVVIDFISGGILLVYPSLEVILFLNLTFLACLIWYIGYYSLHQTHVFLLQREPSVSDNNLEIEEIKTEQPPSAVNTSPELQKKLEELFKIQQIYKNQNLTLRETAIQLATTDKKLSNYLNTSLDTTFYEYVNSYRIEHFKENIRNKQFENLTLLAIAFDAGFNSKATFNRVFKQQEGITPLQFKKSIEKSLIASSESI
ncbi:helix-turn-helix domain-containing protein [uncultured Tenacibaculum sp.]|uniref:helix-turn-helix domain-containing protein n=1 Tax=uncultured Tenacibaculum sp. TaxID=174713 RepID=UPI00262C2611|nr:helix-turn-helix domain-containing protein [uncultured Tenacibaculum sp.]